MRTETLDKDDRVLDAKIPKRVQKEWDLDEEEVSRDLDDEGRGVLAALVEMKKKRDRSTAYEVDADVAADEEFLFKFPDQARPFVIKHIKNFFGGRKMYCGGPIMESLLLSEPNVRMVMNTRMANAITMMFEAMENYGFDDDVPEDHASEEAAILLEICNRECFDRKIPKTYVGGIALLFLEFCKGIKCPRRAP